MLKMQKGNRCLENDYLFAKCQTIVYAHNTKYTMHLSYGNRLCVDHSIIIYLVGSLAAITYLPLFLTFSNPFVCVCVSVWIVMVVSMFPMRIFKYKSCTCLRAVYVFFALSSLVSLLLFYQMIMDRWWSAEDGMNDSKKKSKVRKTVLLDVRILRHLYLLINYYYHKKFQIIFFECIVANTE